MRPMWIIMTELGKPSKVLLEHQNLSDLPFNVILNLLGHELIKQSYIITYGILSIFAPFPTLLRTSHIQSCLPDVQSSSLPSLIIVNIDHKVLAVMSPFSVACFTACLIDGSSFQCKNNADKPVSIGQVFRRTPDPDVPPQGAENWFTSVNIWIAGTQCITLSIKAWQI